MRLDLVSPVAGPAEGCKVAVLQHLGGASRVKLQQCDGWGIHRVRDIGTILLYYLVCQAGQ